MSLTHLTDENLIASFQDLLVDERERLVLQLEHLVELDRRKLFFHYPSLRAYLVEEHGMEEWLAERRIRAARMLKRFPALKEKLESGKLNLTLLELAQGFAHREKWSDAEFWEILEAIAGMSCRKAERELASRYPRSVEISKDRVRPLTAELSEVSFVASQELLDKLEDIRGLLAHSHPGIKLGELIDVLATEYRERHHPEEKAKRAEVRKARKNPGKIVESPTAPWAGAESEKRTPSQTMTHELVRTQGYQCAFVDPVTKLRCVSTFGLQKDHIQAWSQGGETRLENLRFLCLGHHRRVSFRQFGEASKYASIRRTAAG